MALPPLPSAVNDTVNDPVAAVVDPDTAFTPVGALGTVAGTKLFDAADAGPVPTSFVALTVHVYVRPLVRPDTTIGLDPPVFEPGTPPSDDTHEAA